MGETAVETRRRFAGKVCLVTGGSQGLGLATAHAFVREGARVAIVARDPARLCAAAEEIGNNTIAIAADLSTMEGVASVASALIPQVERLDAVYLNAGYSGFRPLHLMDERTWDRVFDTNVKGAFFLVQAIRPLLKKGSSLVLCGSAAARKAAPGIAAYGASKAALEHLTRILAAELLPGGIRVNIVVPGGMNTDISLHTEGLDPKDGAAFRERLRLQNPMRREGEPAELAAAVLYLASHEADFITGTTLAIDGGFTSIG
jgi:NAD(P)-dependent dehydrogenase (short-subunit alcohol dehydrogenase family)